MARSQPSKNAEKADIVKALRNQFLLEMLLPMVGLKRSTFFYHLAENIDKNTDIVQKVDEIYQEHKGNDGYRRITLISRGSRQDCG